MKKKYTVKKRYSKKHNKKSKIYTKKHNKKGKTYTKRYTKKSKGGSTKKARWKEKPEHYKNLKKTSCSGITNGQTLTKKLKTNFTSKFKQEQSVEIPNFTIFPYCNEDIKGVFSSVDSVNRPFTNYTAIESLKDAFNIQYIDSSLEGLTNHEINQVETSNLDTQDDTSEIDTIVRSNFNTTGLKSEYNDPGKFLMSLKTKHNSTWNAISKDYNYFIVSHSGFMSKLYDYIVKTQGSNLENIVYKNEFDNLDILHLLIDKRIEKNEIIVTNMYVRKYDNSYETDISLNYKYKNKEEHETKTIKRQAYADSNPLIDVVQAEDYWPRQHMSVFIMSDCLGCHNVTPDLINKASQALIHIVKKNKYGYLDWSMCFEDTLDQLVKVKNHLINLMKRYSISNMGGKEPQEVYGINGYQFGSSVIFRAILTSLLMYNVLHDNVDETKLGGTAELSQSKLPEKGEVSGDPPKNLQSKEEKTISPEETKIKDKKPSQTINLICDCNKKKVTIDESMNK